MYNYKEKKCIICGKTYQPAGANQRYCSPECFLARKYKLEKVVVEKICVKCGKKFETDNAVKKYCSYECQRTRNVVVVEKICAECGKKFETTRVGQIFCSELCRIRNQSKKQSRRIHWRRVKSEMLRKVLDENNLSVREASFISGVSTWLLVKCKAADSRIHPEIAQRLIKAFGEDILYPEGGD